MNQSGTMTVKCHGRVEILLPFKPNEAKVEFVDDPIPSLPSCEIVKPDGVDVEILFNDEFDQYSLFFMWETASPRVIRWTATRHLTGTISCK